MAILKDNGSSCFFLQYSSSKTLLETLCLSTFLSVLLLTDFAISLGVFLGCFCCFCCFLKSLWWLLFCFLWSYLSCPLLLFLLESMPLLLLLPCFWWRLSLDLFWEWIFSLDLVWWCGRRFSLDLFCFLEGGVQLMDCCLGLLIGFWGFTKFLDFRFLMFPASLDWFAAVRATIMPPVGSFLTIKSGKDWRKDPRESKPSFLNGTPSPVMLL